MKRSGCRLVQRAVAMLVLGAVTASGCAGGGPEESTQEFARLASALSACPHDVLCTGAAMPSATKGSGCTTSSGANGYCVPEVCADHPSCCATAWTDTCVQDMKKYTKAGGFAYDDCPAAPATPAPACGSAGCGECSAHSTALESTCDSCTSAVCSHDSYCCTTAWDGQCVSEVSTYCGAAQCSSCTPTSCAVQGKTCGSISDGCGGTLSCGTCPPGQVCTSSNTCSSSCGGTGSAGDLGPVTVTGNVKDGNASMSRLLFGVLGDTRPSSYATSYPSSLVTLVNGLYADMQAQQLPFVIATGDYGFVNSASAASTQYSQYMSAVNAAGYGGKFFPAIGNHECKTTTSVNCCPNDGDSSCSGAPTAMYGQWLGAMLSPIGQALPYYQLRVKSSVNDASGNPTWTAKFIFLADNAWDSKQLAWFNAQVATPTSYTFVVHHVPANATSSPAPGTAAINGAISAATSKGQITLVLVGHTHMYAAPGGPTPYGNEPSYEVLIGNGGAPLQSGATNGTTYGHAVVSQRPCDDAIVVDMYGQGNASVDAAFRFAVNPDGSKASP